MRARNTVILECQQFKIPQDHETCYKSTSWRVERAFFGPEAAYARGRLVSLEGFSIAFCAKNGEWRDSHLGFQVSFASPWLQWRNLLIQLQLNLLNVQLTCVYLHHRRSKFVYFVPKLSLTMQVDDLRQPEKNKNLFQCLKTLASSSLNRHKNISPRQICFDCFPLIVTQFRIARGLESILYHFRNRPHVGIGETQVTFQCA